MTDFDKQPKAGDVFQTDGYFRDAAGVDHSIWCKILAIAAFPNNATANTAHGIAAINLEAGVNVRKVNCRLTAPPTVTAQDKSKMSFGVTAANLAITTTTDLSAYSGEVWLEYCPS